MRLYRIGDKVVSRDKLFTALEDILEAREAGATQEDVAREHLVQRTFVSFLETLGEVRRGPRVALVGFPVANGPEVKALAEKHAVDFVLVLSQAEREQIESGGGADVFNALMETIAVLRGYDTVVLLASDWRVRTIEKALGAEVIGISLGPSPLRNDVQVDLAELEAVLEGVMSARRARRPKSRIGAAAKQVAELTGRWIPSKR